MASVSFYNDTNLTLYIAIAYYDQGCSGNSAFRKEGWFKLLPRQKKTLWDGASDLFYYIAIDEKHEWTWGGNSDTELPSHPFSRCMNEPGGTRYGMRVFEPKDDHTINLFTNPF
ncbi:DUF1036 domain-containing protein [Bacillus cereus]|uniref:DUF1036 domain-containing protein n=1 Tax=Bacillus cereus TaxID=1396 RepID=UPI0035702DDD